MTNEGVRTAIVDHVMSSVKNGEGKDLRIALLTRDVMDEICLKVAKLFVERLRTKLHGKDPEMEPLMGSLTNDKYSGIWWRHSSWPLGAAIYLEFDRARLNWACGGFYAPNKKACAELSDDEKAEYIPVEDKVRDQIRAAIPDGSAFWGSMDQGWPTWAWMEEPLFNWNTIEAMPIIAGCEKFKGQMLVDWLADEFMEIRKALREILG